MDLRQVRAFIAVAEELNFTRAAERLHRAQSPLSRQIAALEAHLGAQLFTRSKRHVQLTPAGEAFLPEARALLTQAARSVSVVRQAAGQDGVKLRVGFMDGTTYNVMPAALQHLKERRPDVQVDLSLEAPQVLLQKLRCGALDAAFLLAPFDAAGLQFRTLFSDPLVVILPASHPQASQPEVPLRALADLPLLLHPREHAPELYDWITGLCEQSGFTPTIERHTTEVHVKHGLVAAGLGWAFALKSFQSTPRAGLVFRPVQGRTVDVGTALAWSGNVSEGAALTSLITCAEHAAQRFE